MSLEIYKDTPRVIVRDNRGLTVRNIEYNRSNIQETPKPYITQNKYNKAGLLISSMDPRRFAHSQTDANISANFVNYPTLSGQILRSYSVDKGTCINLKNIAGVTEYIYDSKHTRTRIEGDANCRPVAIYVKALNQHERCISRLTYGTDALANNWNQIIRHYDTAGILKMQNYTITGKSVSQTRILLKNLKNQSSILDWPIETGERNALLENEDYTTSFRYGGLGQLYGKTDAKGNIHNYTYNITGQLKKQTLKLKDLSKEETLVDKIIYNVYGQIISQEDGNNIITKSIYDFKTRRLVQLQTLRNNIKLQDLNYEYDPVGNIIKVEDKAQDTKYTNNSRINPITTYKYDALYQLIETTGRECLLAGRNKQDPLPNIPVINDANMLNNYTRSWSYDVAGNLLKMTHRGANSFTQEMIVSNTNNRSIIKSDINISNPNQAIENMFDANGNLLELAPGQKLIWNLSNQLSKVTQVVRSYEEQTDSQIKDDSEDYIYDGQGQRICKIRTYKVGNTNIEDKVIYLPNIEIRNEGNKQLEIISVQAGRTQVRILDWVKNKPNELENNQLRYSYADQLGSIQLELDRQGQIISYEEYYPFGGTALWSARSQIEAKYKYIRYSGKEKDATGLYYYGFRYYAPWLCRWLNPDPAGPVDGLNLYLMVGNNPIKYIDSNGLVKTIAENYDGSRGDLMYGLAIPRARAARGVNGVFIDDYNNKIMNTITVFNQDKIANRTSDNLLFESIAIPDDLKETTLGNLQNTSPAVWEEYFKNLNIKSIYQSAALSRENGLQLVNNNKLINKFLIKKASKTGIKIAAEQSNTTHIHFVLDNVNMEEVVHKNGQYGHSITASELRQAYRLRKKLAGRKSSIFDFITRKKVIPAKIHFYKDNIEVEAPWKGEGKNLWRNYHPSSSNARSSIFRSFFNNIIQTFSNLRIRLVGRRMVYAT